MGHLITSTLLDSYEWLVSCPESWKPRALDDFVAMIRREPRPVSDACERGIEFERLVCDNCDRMSHEDFRRLVASRYSGWLKGAPLERAVESVCDVADSCRGGMQQVAVMKDVCIDGKDFHLFGYADVVFPDRIVDIKTTGNYKGDGAYLKRSQHFLYSLCTGIKDFEYVVAVFRGKYPACVERIRTRVSEQECVSVLERRIRNVTRFLENAGLWNDYENHFTGGHKDRKN